MVVPGKLTSSNALILFPQPVVIGMVERRIAVLRAILERLISDNRAMFNCAATLGATLSAQ